MLAATQGSTTLLDVAPVAISGLSLLFGGLLGGGGYMAWRISQAQIVEERANYWKRERQEVYAKALDIYYDVRSHCSSIRNEFQHSATPDPSEIAPKLTALGNGIDDFGSVRSVIDLLSSAETRAKAAELMDILERFFFAATDELQNEHPDRDRVVHVYSDLSRCKRELRDAFRRELGLDPLYGDESNPPQTLTD